jgi:hypothetical protein
MYIYIIKLGEKLFSIGIDGGNDFEVVKKIYSNDYTNNVNNKKVVHTFLVPNNIDFKVYSKFISLLRDLKFIRHNNSIVQCHYYIIHYTLLYAITLYDKSIDNVKKTIFRQRWLDKLEYYKSFKHNDKAEGITDVEDCEYNYKNEINNLIDRNHSNNVMYAMYNNKRVML